MCDAAIAALATETDVCVAYARCNPRRQRRCAPRLSALARHDLLSLYGAFSELHRQHSVYANGTAVVQRARLGAVAAAECHQIEHIVASRCAESQLLVPLAGLLQHAEPGRCMRTFVYERCASGATLARLPSWDARDTLLGITRVAAPGLDGSLPSLVAAHKSWLRGQGVAAEAATLLPATWYQAPAPAPACLQQSGALAMTREQLERFDSHGAAFAPPPRARGLRGAGRLACEREAQLSPGQLQQKLSGALATLLGAAAAIVARNRTLEPPAPSPPPPPPLPLGCLELGFWQHHRELLPGARAPAPPCNASAAAVRAAADLARLHSLLHAVQGEGAPCGSRATLRVHLNPSGWFSALHGLLKPLMRAVRRGAPLLSPRLLPFTAPACSSRDLRCFFQPLSACDAAADAVASGAKGGGGGAKGGGGGGGGKGGGKGKGSLGRVITATGRVTADVSRARAAEVIPAALRRRGWFWWSAQMLAHILRPNAALAGALEAEAAKTGLAAALAAGPVLGMHVRHGDACLAKELARTKRTCSPLAAYMPHARAVAAATGARVIYLATDSPHVVAQTAAYPEFRWLWVEMARLDTRRGPPKLWDERVWSRQVWGQTAWTQEQARLATVDMMLLARCTGFVGKFTSNFFRAAYTLHAAWCECAAPFVSLDAPWCFDYGLFEANNWDHPFGTNATKLLEGRRGNSLQC